MDLIDSQFSRQKPKKREKWSLLVSIYFLSLSMGLVYEILSPTLDELALVTDSSMKEISSLFTVRSAAYALGSLCGAGIYHLTLPLLSLTIATIINSMSIAWVGFLKDIYGMNGAIAINGLSTGIIDVGTTVCILRLFEKKSGPYIMALYAIFSLGSSLLNLYTAPFLIDIPMNVSLASNTTISYSTSSQIYVPFIITGLVTLIPVILFLVIFFNQLHLSKNRRLPFIMSFESRQKSRYASSLPFSSSTVLIMFLSGLMLMLYSGMDIVFSEYILIALKRSKLGINASQASYIKSVMNLSQTFSKFVFIFISTLVSPLTTLIFNSIIVLLSSIMLIIGFNHSISIIWIFCIIFSISASSIYPSMYPFIELYLPIDHWKGSFFIFLSGLMPIICPYFVGSLLDEHPTLILYLEILTIILTLFCIISIWFSGRKLLQLQKKESDVKEPALYHETLPSS